MSHDSPKLSILSWGSCFHYYNYEGPKFNSSKRFNMRVQNYLFYHEGPVFMTIIMGVQNCLFVMRVMIWLLPWGFKIQFCYRNYYEGPKLTNIQPLLNWTFLQASMEKTACHGYLRILIQKEKEILISFVGFTLMWEELSVAFLQ